MSLLLASLVAALAPPFNSIGCPPVVSALVMPAGLIGLLVMPFGLDIDWMITVSQWVANRSGAGRLIGELWHSPDGAFAHTAAPVWSAGAGGAARL